MKKIFIGVVGLLVIFVVIGIVALYNIGTIVEKTVNKYGPGITQTDVKIGAVDVALLAGKAEMQNFLLGNPEGFESETAMAIRSVQLDVNEKTVFSDPLVIEEVRLVSPEINYILKGKTDNFRTILQNVQESIGAEKAPSEKAPGPSPEQPGKKVIIEDFYLSGGEVQLSASGLQKNVRAKIPDIHMQNIGGEGGTVPAEAVAIIMDRIYEVIQSAEVRNALNKQLKELGVDLEKFRIDPGQVEILRKGAEESVKDQMKKFLGR